MVGIAAYLLLQFARQTHGRQFDECLLTKGRRRTDVLSHSVALIASQIRLQMADRMNLRSPVFLDLQGLESQKP
jgi:hypothetical protein